MDVVKSIVRAVVPADTRRIVSVARRHAQAVSIDAWLTAEASEMDPALIADTKLLPNRSAMLDRMPKQGIFAEVGVFRGAFAMEILARCRPSKLYLIDAWEHEPAHMEEVKALFRSEIDAGQVEICRGMSWDMLARFPDSLFDFIYIDADHQYDSAKRDLRTAFPKVKRDGFLAGHDYTRWLSLGLNRCGVVEAVNELANETQSPLAYLTNESCRVISFALRKTH